MRKAKREKATVWVVMHYEFMGPKSAHVDSVQFHVASSLRDAEEYIRERWVSPYSWWQIHPHVVDDEDLDHNEGEEVHYYSHRGRRLLHPPFRQALWAFERERELSKTGRKKRKDHA